MKYLYISAAIVVVTVLIVVFGLDFIGGSGEPIEEGGGPYVPADEAPVMQEENPG